MNDAGQAGRPHSPGRFSGKCALVTGAGSGIGQAAAIRLASEGASVAVVDLIEERACAVAGLITGNGGRALAIRADVGSEDMVAAAFGRCLAEWGRLDVVVSNAGIELAEDAPVHNLECEAWERTLRTNLTGAFLTCKHGVRALLRNPGGAVVIIGSPAGLYGMELGFHAYSASKGGVHGLARVMASEYAASGIRVNVVVPGLIRTPINDPFFARPELVERTLASIPAGREGQPAEIAAAIAFLASDEASYAVGALFAVDGGLTAV